MLKWLANRSTLKTTARQLYGGVVAQARDARFYRDLDVADTAEGRYELVALHLVLVLERLGKPDVGNENLRRELVETFITDMDDSLREMGVGDTSVAKKVKKAAGGVYTRAGAYREALSQPGDAALEAALSGYVYLGQSPRRAPLMAQYVRAAVAKLEQALPADLAAGHVVFPDPETVR